MSVARGTDDEQKALENYTKGLMATTPAKPKGKK